MKRTMLKRRTPLKAKRGIKPVSDKKTQQFIEEVPIRKQLAERCGATWMPFLWHKEQETTVELMGRCVGGICEECGNPPDFRGLSPHEKVFRSRGGKLSLSNSIMVCGSCHAKYHNLREA